MADKQTMGKDEVSEVLDNLEDVLGGLEGDRKKLLNGLKALQNISQNLLQREVNRLKEKLGADHPRVKRLKVQTAKNLKLIAVLEAEIELADIRAPEINKNVWVVQGKVVGEESQRGIGGLLVSLYDKDLFFDDTLGITVTDEQGNFEIAYPTAAFRDLFEAKPDLYIKVLDESGRTLFNSRKRVRPEASHFETFYIIIKEEPEENDRDE